MGFTVDLRVFAFSSSLSDMVPDVESELVLASRRLYCSGDRDPILGDGIELVEYLILVGVIGRSLIIL